MATFRKLKSGKWNVQIRKKNNQFISKTFIEKSLARKWAREIENQIDKNIYEDYTQAETTTLRDIIKKYKPLLPSNSGGKKRGQSYHYSVIWGKPASKFWKGIAQAMADQWGTDG